METHVVEIGGGEIGERARHAVEERLAADEADVGIGAGGGKQVLAGPEADLEPDLAHRPHEGAR